MCVDACCCCKTRTRVAPGVLAAARRSSIAQALTLGANDSGSSGLRSPGGVSLDDFTVEECSCCAEGAACGPEGCCGPYGCLGPVVRSCLFLWRILTSLAEILVGHCMVRVGGETFWVVHPDRRWRWDVVVMLLVLYVAWETPFTQAFEPDWPWASAVGAFIDGLFLVDVIVNARSAFWTPERKLEIRAWPILSRYAMTWMLVDVASCVPFDLLTDSGLLDTRSAAGAGQTAGLDVRLVSGLKAVRLFRLHRLAKVLSHLQSSSMFGIFRLYGAILLLGHWLACLWYVVTLGILPGGVGETWALNAGINGYVMVASHDTSGDESLISNASQATVTAASASAVSHAFNARALAGSDQLPHYVPATTAGGASIATQRVLPGQEHSLRPIIRPARASSLWYNYVTSLVEVILALFRTQRFRATTIPESLFLLFLVLIGAALQAVVFGQVAFLVSKLNSARSAFDQQMSDVRDRMRYNKLPESLIQRVTDYYERQFETHRLPVGQSDPVSWVKLIGNEPLSNELSLFVHRDLILKVDIFRGASADVILKIVKALHSTLYLPGDYIVKLGEVGNEMFFVRSGECMVLLPLADDASDASSVDDNADTGALVIPGMRTAKTLGAGAAFGELALLFSTERTATVVSSTYSDLSALAAEDFDRILEENMEFGILLMRNFQTYIQRDYQSGSATVVPASAMELPDASVLDEGAAAMANQGCYPSGPNAMHGERATVPFMGGEGYSAVESRLLSSGETSEQHRRGAHGAVVGPGDPRHVASRSSSDSARRSSSRSRTGSTSTSTSSSSSLSGSRFRSSSSSLDSSSSRARRRRHRRRRSTSTSRSSSSSRNAAPRANHRRHDKHRAGGRGNGKQLSSLATGASGEMIQAARGYFLQHRGVVGQTGPHPSASRADRGDVSAPALSLGRHPLSGGASRAVLQLAVRSIIVATKEQSNRGARTTKRRKSRTGAVPDDATYQSATGIDGPTSDNAFNWEGGRTPRRSFSQHVGAHSDSGKRLGVHGPGSGAGTLPPVKGASNPRRPSLTQRLAARSSRHELATAPTDSLRRRRRSSLLAALHAADGTRRGPNLVDARPSHGGSHSAILTTGGLAKDSSAQGALLFQGVRSGAGRFLPQPRDAAALRQAVAGSSGGSGSAIGPAATSYGSVVSVHSDSDPSRDSRRARGGVRGDETSPKGKSPSRRRRHSSRHRDHRRSKTTGSHRRHDRRRRSSTSTDGGGASRRRRSKGPHHRKHRKRDRKAEASLPAGIKSAPAPGSSMSDLTAAGRDRQRKPPPAPPRTSTGPTEESDSAFNATPADKVASLFQRDDTAPRSAGDRVVKRSVGLSRSISPKAPPRRQLAGSSASPPMSKDPIRRPVSTTPNQQAKGKGGVVWKQQDELEPGGAGTSPGAVSAGSPRLSSRKSKSAHDLKGLPPGALVHPAVHAVAAAARHAALQPPSTGGSEVTVPSAVGRAATPDASHGPLRSMEHAYRDHGAGAPMARVLSFNLTAQKQSPAGSKAGGGKGSRRVVQRLFRANSLQQGGESTPTHGTASHHHRQQGRRVAAQTGGAARVDDGSAFAMAHVQQMLEALAVAKGSSLGANVIPRQSVLRGLTNATRVLGRLPGILEPAPLSGGPANLAGTASTMSLRPTVAALTINGSAQQPVTALPTSTSLGQFAPHAAPASTRSAAWDVAHRPEESAEQREFRVSAMVRDAAHMSRMMQVAGADAEDAPHWAAEMASSDLSGHHLAFPGGAAGQPAAARSQGPGARRDGGGSGSRRPRDKRDSRSAGRAAERGRGSSGREGRRRSHRERSQRSPRERHRSRRSRSEDSSSTRHRHRRRERLHRSRSGEDTAQRKPMGRPKPPQGAGAVGGRGEGLVSPVDRHSRSRPPPVIANVSSSREVHEESWRRSIARSGTAQSGCSSGAGAEADATTLEQSGSRGAERSGLAGSRPTAVRTIHAGRGKVGNPMRLGAGDRSLSTSREGSISPKAGSARPTSLMHGAVPGTNSNLLQRGPRARERRHSAPKAIVISGGDGVFGFSSRTAAGELVRDHAVGDGDGYADDDGMETGAAGADAVGSGRPRGRQSIRAVQEMLSTPPASSSSRQSMPATEHLRRVIRSPEFVALLQGDARRRRQEGGRASSPRYSSHAAAPAKNSRLEVLQAASHSGEALSPARSSPKASNGTAGRVTTAGFCPDALDTTIGDALTPLRASGGLTWNPAALAAVASAGAGLSEAGVRRIVKEELAQFRQRLLQDLAAMMRAGEVQSDTVPTRDVLQLQAPKF